MNTQESSYQSIKLYIFCQEKESKCGKEGENKNLFF